MNHEEIEKLSLTCPVVARKQGFSVRMTEEDKYKVENSFIPFDHELIVSSLKEAEEAIDDAVQRIKAAWKEHTRYIHISGHGVYEVVILGQYDYTYYCLARSRFCYDMDKAITNSIEPLTIHTESASHGLYDHTEENIQIALDYCNLERRFRDFKKSVDDKRRKLTNIEWPEGLVTVERIGDNWSGWSIPLDD